MLSFIVDYSTATAIRGLLTINRFNVFITVMVYFSVYCVFFMFRFVELKHTFIQHLTNSFQQVLARVLESDRSVSQL